MFSSRPIERHRLGFALLCSFVTGCGSLDTGNAHRCSTTSDCLAGRVCYGGLCKAPVEVASDARVESAASDASKMQDAAHDALYDSGTTVIDGGAHAPASQDSGGIDAEVIADDDGGGQSLCVQLDITKAPGVVMWLDADRGAVSDGQGHLMRWDDRSKSQLSALPTGSDTTWPLLIANADGRHAAVRFGVVPGGSAVRRLKIADGPNVQFGSDDFAVIAVVRYRNSTAAGINEIGAIYEKQGNGSGFPGPALFANDNWSQYVGGGPNQSSFVFQVAALSDHVARSPASGFNDDRVHVVAARRRGRSLSVDVDDKPHATGLAATIVNVSSPGVDLSIGAHQTENKQALEGDIFQLIVVRQNAAHDISPLVQCLIAEYGLQ